jgi:hypothetical protein
MRRQKIVHVQMLGEVPYRNVGFLFHLFIPPNGKFSRRGGRVAGIYCWPNLMDIQLYFDGFLDLAHVFIGKNAGSSEKPLLAHRRYLIRHGLAFFSFKHDRRLAGIDAIYVACKGNDLNPVEEFVRRVITYDYGGALLPNLATY